MTDVVAPEVRSRIMSRIRSKDTSAELTVRSFLHRSGLRYRIHRRDLAGVPDIVLPKRRAVVFVHGCFWHQHPKCKHSGVPLSNRDYWQPKLKRTVGRDRNHLRTLKQLGWSVYVIWECEVEPRRLRELVESIKKDRRSRAWLSHST